MITHPEKVLFPDAGITKGELAAYYESMAPSMLPHIRARPLTLERYPSGIGGEGFWQKNVPRGAPAWLERVAVPKKDGTVTYPLLTDLGGVLWMANQNTITPHVWTARMPKLHHPDLCVFDLDPPEDADPVVLRRMALAVRDILDQLGLGSWAKTSGSKGFHVVISLDSSARTGDVARFANAVAARLLKRHPDHLTQEFSKADRGGRILLDTGRNGHGATFAAPYAVRAKPGAPVSAPCTWQEIENGTVAPRTFTLRTMAARVAEVGELWAGMPQQQLTLRAAADRLKASG